MHAAAALHSRYLYTSVTTCLGFGCTCTAWAGCRHVTDAPVRPEPLVAQHVLQQQRCCHELLRGTARQISTCVLCRVRQPGRGTWLLFSLKVFSFFSSVSSLPRLTVPCKSAGKHPWCVCWTCVAEKERTPSHTTDITCCILAAGMCNQEVS